MKNQSSSVDQFMQTLDHPFKDEIVMVRQIILSADENITEHIKWNAPSFCYNGDDRITFRLHPPKNIQFIFHRGAKVKDSSDFSFKDSTGLIKWITKDRGTVTFENKKEVVDHKEDMKILVKEWMKVTT
jgi:hypothetical protein